jgi:Tol biopolymer transport system component
MESSSSSPSTSGAPAAVFWPNALRDEPRREPFPWRFLTLWLLPGIVAALLLAALAILLQQQADKRIVFLSPEGQLAWTHADPDDEHAVGDREWYLNSSARMKLQKSLPVSAGPIWSPSNGSFAATVTDTGKIQVAIFTRLDGKPTLISSETAEIIALPAEGWAPDGTTLALLESAEDQVLLSLIDLRQQQVITSEVNVDIRAPLAWSPDSAALLLTTRTEQFTPTLALVTSTGQVESFSTDDGQQMRADGTWSPDGKQVAYIVPDRAATEEVGLLRLLAGSLWLAQSGTGTAQKLVADGLNFAPIWAPEGNSILFTRFLTETSALELYRMDADGKNPTKLGPGSAAMATHPFDRRRSLSWSPDGQRLFFVATDVQGISEIYLAAADGSNAEPISAPCALAQDSSVQWAPTSRSLLIACADGRMLLHWVDAERSPTMYPPGVTPAWEP